MISGGCKDGGQARVYGSVCQETWSSATHEVLILATRHATRVLCNPRKVGGNGCWAHLLLEHQQQFHIWPDQREQILRLHVPVFIIISTLQSEQHPVYITLWSCKWGLLSKASRESRHVGDEAIGRVGMKTLLSSSEHGCLSLLPDKSKCLLISLWSLG